MRGLTVMLLFSLVSVVLGLLPGGVYVSLTVQFTIGLVLQAGWNLFCLKLVRDEDASPMVIFEPFSRFGQTWLVSIAILAMTFVGLIVFIIPGLYLLTRFGMGVFVLVDRKLDVVESLRFSSMITEGNRLQILLLQLILGGLSMILLAPSQLEQEGSIGILMLLIYQFILVPFAGAAYAAAYDSLVETRAGEEI
jgi:uncharacterized membrane protein